MKAFLTEPDRDQKILFLILENYREHNSTYYDGLLAMLDDKNIPYRIIETKEDAFLVINEALYPSARKKLRSCLDKEYDRLK